MGKVLVACEESQRVCIQFRKLGHIAYSCDLKPCSGGFPKWHLQGDVLDFLDCGWDLLIGHPPCTYLSYMADRVWNDKGRLEKRLDALNFFAKLWLAPIPRICLENPAGCASPVIAKYSQMIQPYYFGDSDSKRTWLWLKNLPLLVPTEIVKPKVYKYGNPVLRNGKFKLQPIYFSDIAKDSTAHSKTFPGIAKAMALQWGEWIK
jgi:hypothetical protein